jgi:hypothetical protein
MSMVIGCYVMMSIVVGMKIEEEKKEKNYVLKK